MQARKIITDEEKVALFSIHKTNVALIPAGKIKSLIQKMLVVFLPIVKHLYLP